MDRPLVVLIHGWCCHPGFWQHQCSAFAGRGYPMTIPDLRHVKPQGDAICALAEDVAAAADGQDRAGVVLIGHSLGGAVALEAGILLGGRCRLVLGVDTFTDAAFYAGRPCEEIERRIVAVADDFTGTMESMADRIIAPDNKPGVLPWVAREMASAEPGAAIWALRGLLAWNVARRLPALRCPIATINSAWLDRTCSHVPGLGDLGVHPIEGVGHFPMLEAPDRFNTLALAVIDEALGAARCGAA